MKLSSLLTLLAVLTLFVVFQGYIVLQRYWDPRAIVAEEAMIMGTTIKVGTPVSGIVQDVLVYENQWVERGQPIAKILPQSPVQPEGGAIHAITASRAGVITSIAIEEGSFIRSDETIAKIFDGDFEELYVRAYLSIPPEDVAVIRPMQRATVQANYLNNGQSLQGIVSSVDPRYDAKNQIIGVNLRFTEYPMAMELPYEGVPVLAKVQVEDQSALQRFIARMRDAVAPSIQASTK